MGNNKLTTKKFIFLSPHLDDAILSCGAIIDQLAEQSNDVEIWTIFAGDPPDSVFSPFAKSLHERWITLENPTKIRREEDIKACTVINAGYRHFSLPDCIYRKTDTNTFLVNREEDLYQSIPDNQLPVVNQVKEIINSIPVSDTDLVLCPLSIGNHVDHRIVRKALKEVRHTKIAFYPDYPYVIKASIDIAFWIQPQWHPIQFTLSSKNISQWIKAIGRHKSQISTFWKNTKHLENEIITYAKNGGGEFIWTAGDF